MSQKKRAKGGWNAGKAYKKESNRSERQFEKQEIQEELTKIEQGDEYRTKSGGKKKKTKLAKLQKQLTSNEKYLRIFSVSDSEWMKPFIDRLKNSNEKIKKKIKELEDKADKK